MSARVAYASALAALAFMGVALLFALMTWEAYPGYWSHEVRVVCFVIAAIAAAMAGSAAMFGPSAYVLKKEKEAPHD